MKKIKLSLPRETVRLLTVRDQRQIDGGLPTSNITCDTVSCPDVCKSDRNWR